MLGFVRALWSAFDRVMAWRRALVLGLAEQGANVLLPAGGAGGPALGAVVMTRLGVPAELAAGRHAALFLITSAVSFVAMVVFGTLTSIGVLPNGGAPLLAHAAAGRRGGDRDRAGARVRARGHASGAARREAAHRVRARAPVRALRRPHERRAAAPRRPAADLRRDDLLRVRRRRARLRVRGLRRRRAAARRVRAGVHARARGRVPADAGRRGRRRRRADRDVRGLRGADRARGDRRARLPRLPARAAGDPRRDQPPTDPPRARASAAARGGRRALRGAPQAPSKNSDTPPAAHPRRHHVRRTDHSWTNP